MMIVYALVWLSCSVQSFSSEEVYVSDRRIWSVCYNNGSCSCGPNIRNAVMCTEGEEFIKIHNCYCIFYDQEKNTSFLGTCMSSCYNQLGTHPNFLYYSVDHYSIANARRFNAEICNATTHVQINREGRFCGKCSNQFGLAAYSYHYIQCIECKNYGYKNWIKYFAVALLPLTLFILLVILLKVYVPSSHLNGIIFMMQCLTSPILMRSYDAILQTQADHKYQTTGAKISFTIFGMFNLDFFRDIYTYFCLHPELNILAVASLDYIIALYPFLLILMTYILIKLYDRNCTLIVLMWKPFKWCFKHYNTQWDVGASLVQTFASLILLSSVKILGVMFDILTPTRAYTTNGSYHFYLYYDANIDYLHGQHLFYALISLFFSFIFVVLPFFLLILYPCRCFQRILNLLRWRCQALHIFMDAFQGSYRIEPYDLRYFSAFHLLFRFLLLLTLTLTQTMFAFPAAACLMLTAAIIFAFFRPYKNNFHNMLDVISMMLLALFFISYTASLFANSLDQYWSDTGLAFIVGTIFVSFLYCIIILLFKTIKNILQSIITRAMKFKETSVNSTRSIERFDDGSGERALLNGSGN